MRGVKNPPLPGEDEAGTLASFRPLYLEWLAERGYSAETISDRARDLYAFIVWADERALRQPRDITRPILEGYQRHLHHRRKEDGEALSFRTQRGQLFRHPPSKRQCRRGMPLRSLGTLTIDMGRAGPQPRPVPPRFLAPARPPTIPMRVSTHAPDFVDQDTGAVASAEALLASRSRVPPVKVAVTLDATGALAEPPSVVREPWASPDPGRLRAEGEAIRAVIACAPYAISPSGPGSVEVIFTS